MQTFLANSFGIPAQHCSGLILLLGEQVHLAREQDEQLRSNCNYWNTKYRAAFDAASMDFGSPPIPGRECRCR